MLNPPIGDRNTVDFATAHFVSRDDNHADAHANSALRATMMAEAALLGKLRTAPRWLLACVTALVGLVLTFAKMRK